MADLQSVIFQRKKQPQPISVPRQLEEFDVFEFGVFDAEAEGGADDLPALDAAGAGVEGEHLVVLVEHDFKDVGVSADEDFWAVAFDQGPGPHVIVPGVASDVGHQHAFPFADEKLVRGVDAADVLAVAIAIDPPDGLEIRDAAGEFFAVPPVACMPDLIDRLQEIFELPVEYPVGVGNQSYVHVNRDFSDKPLRLP